MLLERPRIRSSLRRPSSRRDVAGINARPKSTREIGIVNVWHLACLIAALGSQRSSQRLLTNALAGCCLPQSVVASTARWRLSRSFPYRQ